MVKKPRDIDEQIPPEEFALFLAMREKAKAGARVHFRYDCRTGELVAHEEVLHRASDYKARKVA